VLKFGLALSGGGFRAALYHLGVVRFLRDAGALQGVTDIASVSGGSILAAHLTLNWDRYNGDDASFDEAAAEIVKSVQFDLRNHIVRRLPLQVPLRMLARLPFIDRRQFTPNALLERYYEKHLYGDRCLHELPERPMLHMLATNVSTGALSAFNRDGLFIQQRGSGDRQPFKHVPGQLARVARVVGASSAFPGFFPPVAVTAADLGVRDGQFPTEYFTDGGVFDNLGLRAFLWLQQHDEEFDHVFVSDAGKPFQILSDATLGVIGQSVRASDILWDRVWQLERENFSHLEGFTFLPITEAVKQSDDPTALHPVVQREVQSIRTDLDRFSTQEIRALVQHGYEVTRKLCRDRNLLGDQQLPEGPPWTPIASPEVTPTGSTTSKRGGTSETTRLARQLQQSSRRRVLSTLLDWRDWPSYLYLAVGFVLLFLLPLQVYQLYRKSHLQGEIIDSITSGDTDIRLILELATVDPTVDWVSQEVLEKSEPTQVSYEGLEILSQSRIYDLRRWRPDEESPERRGHVYIRDRVTLKFLKSYEGDGRVTFAAPLKLKDVDFRQLDPKLNGTISRIAQSVQDGQRTGTIYEFDFDLSQVLPEEPVTIEVELIGDAPKTVRAPFVTYRKADLISAWLFFPADRPYRTYSLVSYPVDLSEPPKPMNERYAIDHPYGSMIGWSVVNPDENHVYECRWTTE
jgi:predicted acylesterase/phospholipase RssA